VAKTVRLVDDRTGNAVPELEASVGGDDLHRARPVGIDELVSAHFDEVEERAGLDEGAGEVEDDPRPFPRAGGAEDVRRVAPGQELVEAQAGRERALPVPTRHAEDAEAIDASALLVALVDSSTKARCQSSSSNARPAAGPFVWTKLAAKKSATAAPPRPFRIGRPSSLVQLRLLGEGDRYEALLVGRGGRPVGRLQPGKLGIVDERAEEEATVAVGAEAAVAQMLLEGFGRPRHGYPRGLLPGGKTECMGTAGRRWRGAIIAILLGLGIAMTVAWGWTAALVYAFFLGVALSYALFAIGWGRIARQGGGWYYERQLRGHRHH
jgi:hypothetical protein